MIAALFSNIQTVKYVITAVHVQIFLFQVDVFFLSIEENIVQTVEFNEWKTASKKN